MLHSLLLQITVEYNDVVTLLTVNTYYTVMGYVHNFAACVALSVKKTLGIC